MYRITYFQPYSQRWLFQTFSTLMEAQRMIDFYKSCGTPARFV